MTTYADQCIARAEGIRDHKIRVTAVVPKNGIGTAMSFYLKSVDDVPELARRLKKACELLRDAADAINGYSTETMDPYSKILFEEVEELEAPMED